MINALIEIPATIIDVIFLLWFVPRFVGVPWRRKPVSIIWVVLELVYQLIADHYFQGFDLIYIIGVIIISTSFAFSLNKEKPLWCVFAGLLYLITPMLLNSFVYAVFSLFIENIDIVIQGSVSYLRALYILICKIIQFAFYRLVLQIFKRDQTLDLKNGVLSFFFTVATALALGALIKISMLCEFPGADVMILVLASILILLNIILYLMIYQVQALMKSKYELTLIHKQMEFERSRMDEAHTIWDNIRKVKHDLKNHFTVIKGTLDQGDTESCKKYLTGLYQTVESMGNLIRSGNSAIDYIINSKLSNLDGIQVLISGFASNYNDIDDVDLACILGNIIDNALEAQEKVGSDKRIELHFLQKNSNRIIICKNTISDSVLQNNKNLKSTKESPEMHGLGHQIVETTIKKYNGWVDYFEEENIFGVQLILPSNT